MKVLSLSVNAEPLVGKFEGSLEKNGIVVQQELPRYVVFTAHAKHELSIAGGHYHLVSSERKAGKAATGAIAGGLIAGGVGLLAGAAMGAGTKTVLSIHHENVVLVAEFSTAELAKLAAFGVVVGAQAPGVSSVAISEAKMRPVAVLGISVMIALFLLFMCSR